MNCEFTDIFEAEVLEGDLDSNAIRLPPISCPPSRLPEELAHLPPCGEPDTMEWRIDGRPTRICRRHALPSELYRLSDDEGKARMDAVKTRVWAEIILRLSEIELESTCAESAGGGSR